MSFFVFYNLKLPLGERGNIMGLLGPKQQIILQTINRFGVMTSTQLISFLKGEVSHMTVYKAKDKLNKLGFTFEEKIGRQLILFVRPSGVTFLSSSLTPFTKVNYSMLTHQLLMNDAILALKVIAQRKEKCFTFITERELRSSYLDVNFNERQRQNTTLLKKVPDRIPDFVVEEENNRIAYEVELTQKSSKRYIEKMRLYKDEVLNGQYDEIRYLCDTNQIKETVDTYALKEGLGDILSSALLGRLLDVAREK